MAVPHEVAGCSAGSYRDAECFASIFRPRLRSSGTIPALCPFRTVTELPMRTRINWQASRLLALCVTGVVIAAHAADADPKPGRTPAGKNLSPAGVLFRREPGSTTWQAVGPKEELSSADVLL